MARRTLPGVEIRNHKTGELICFASPPRGNSWPQSGFIDPGPRLAGVNLAGMNLRFADLHRADLRGANLTGADLSGAFLAWSMLVGAELTACRLKSSSLFRANLAGARLVDADASSVSFIDADLTYADLTGANLEGADLSGARLCGTILTGAAFHGATLGRTLFAECPTLSLANGLAQVRHEDSSILAPDTLRDCIGDLPEEFLLGCGYLEHELDNLRRLCGDVVHCSLVFASDDSLTASLLETELDSGNIQCRTIELGPRSAGDSLEESPEDEGPLESDDILIIVCSRASLSKKNVLDVIVNATERETSGGTSNLIPVIADHFVFTDEAERLSESVAASNTQSPWLNYLRDGRWPQVSSLRDPSIPVDRVRAEYAHAVDRLFEELDLALIGVRLSAPK